MVDATTAKVYASRSATTNFSSVRDKLPGRRSWAEAFARNDDPAHVPPADEIINYLLGKAVEKFYNAVAPHFYVYEVKLSGVKSDAAKLGNDYAKAGNYEEAARSYKRGIVDEPEDHGAMFNLGVMKEIAGDLDGAMNLYRRAIQVKGKGDKKYMQAETRVRREMEIQRSAGGS